MDPSKAIYLLSSNSEREYIIDILEALALPRSFTHHFRYRLKWVNPLLRATLPTRPLDIGNSLTGLEAVICYLYQEEHGDKREWKSLYAIRRGTIVDCYKSGDKDSDIAHFYFQVTDYYDYSKSNPDSSTGFQKLIEEGSDSRKLENRFYAILGASPGIPVANSDLDESAFHSLVDSINLDHFKSPNASHQKRYLPVFCFFHGIKASEGASDPEPLLEKTSEKTYYELVEGSKYVFQVSYHLPNQFELEQGSEISLHTHSDYFASSRADHIPVASSYDKESLLIIPRPATRGVWGSFDFKTSIKAESNNESEVLDLTRSFPVLIKPRRIRKFLAGIDWIGTTGLAVGTAGIAIWAVTKGDALLYLSIAGYAAAALVNLASRILEI